MRLRFWTWAHRAAEDLWHWIYYHRIPEGIAQRKQNEAKFAQSADMLNKAYYDFQVRMVNRKGEDVSAGGGKG